MALEWEGMGSVALEWEWMRLSIEWRSSNTISDIHSIHLIHCPSIQAQQGQLTTCKVTTSNEYKEDLINHADCIYTYIHHLSTSLGGGGRRGSLKKVKLPIFKESKYAKLRTYVAAFKVYLIVSPFVIFLKKH